MPGVQGGDPGHVPEVKINTHFHCVRLLRLDKLGTVILFAIQVLPAQAAVRGKGHWCEPVHLLDMWAIFSNNQPAWQPFHHLLGQGQEVLQY